MIPLVTGSYFLETFLGALLTEQIIDQHFEIEFGAQIIWARKMKFFCSKFQKKEQEAVLGQKSSFFFTILSVKMGLS